jgi:hypothetical protein
MPYLSWIKLHIDIIANPKLYQLSESQRWRFVQLLALAGECNSEGYLLNAGVPLTPDYLAWRLRANSNVILRDLQALSKVDLVVLDEGSGAWMIPGFAGRQARQSDETREYWREQKRRRQGTSQQAKDEEIKNEASTQTASPDLPLDPEEGSYDIEETNQNSFIEGSPDDGIEVLDQDESPDNLQENIPETFQEPISGTFQEQFPLKRRIEKKRGEKREKERRRGERQRPPPVGRSKPKLAPKLSVFDEVERELAKKNFKPPTKASRKLKFT